MIEIKFDERQLEGVHRLLTELPDELEKAKETALLRIGTDMQAKAVQMAPYKSGNLRRSIALDANANRVTVGTNLVYAKIHDQGGVIPARVIRPRKAKALRFMRGGSYVFAKSVKQPARTVRPYKGRGYLTPAFEEMKKGRAQEILNEEIDHIIDKL